MQAPPRTKRRRLLIEIEPRQVTSCAGSFVTLAAVEETAADEPQTHATETVAVGRDRVARWGECWPLIQQILSSEPAEPSHGGAGATGAADDAGAREEDSELRGSSTSARLLQNPLREVYRRRDASAGMR